MIQKISKLKGSLQAVACAVEEACKRFGESGFWKDRIHMEDVRLSFQHQGNTVIGPPNPNGMPSGMRGPSQGHHNQMPQVHDAIYII